MAPQGARNPSGRRPQGLSPALTANPGSKTISEHPLQNKAALITGAGRGIGKALAYQLAKLGADLILTSRNLDALMRLSAQLRRRELCRVVEHACDVGEMESVEKLAAVIEHKFGRLDIVINNAGVGYSGVLFESEAEMVGRMLLTNLYGPYLVSRFCLPLVAVGGGGVVVNIVSQAGIEGSPGFAMYSATKQGLQTFSEALRLEMAEHNIRVLTVSPGMTRTSFYDRFLAGKCPAPMSYSDLMAPEEVADSIARALLDPDHGACPEITVRTDGPLQ